jgi:serine/threonine protein kinase
VRVDVARAVPSGATDVEPARAFVQDRIKLWAFWVFVLSFGFYLANIATWFFVLRLSSNISGMLLQAGTLDHLAASLVFGGTWVICRRWRLSMEALRRLELLTLFFGCTLYAIMGAYLMRLELAAGLDMTIGGYAGLLACVNSVMARAIAVPSTPHRTLIGSIAAMLPLVPATIFASGSWMMTLNVVSWCAVCIAIATVGSRVIFGLRSEAARTKRLGQYTLEHKIGAGGMGVVYRASHAMLRRPTAIKLLPPERAGEASLVRFEREVQMTAQLSHPNTVAIYDYGRTPEGVFYYAMEYLDGINLEDLVRTRGPLTAGRVVAILDQVCGALNEAHESGLVHRDIKPANIILTERGGEPDVAKVVDFGLVKPLVPSNPDLTTTGTGVLTGTPLYLSPEAMTTPDVADPRSDLYALGAVGYFLLTGRGVFEAGTVAEIIGHHLHTEPIEPSRRVNHPVPHDLESLIMQCLRKDPAARPQSARALREALRACTQVRPWTADEAADWWRTFRSSAYPSAAASAAASGSGSGLSGSDERTMTVDFGDRLTQTAIETIERVGKGERPETAEAVKAVEAPRTLSSRRG